jgi:inner membrane protein
MDPVTHAVIGVAIAKATGNAAALSEPATLCIIAGSMIPDIDILLQKWGDMTYLKNHRGATHSIPGLVISAAIVAGVMSLIFHGWFPVMFLWALAGCLSHAFFDLFNTYGAKLLWPFRGKKYSLGMLMTFDPVFIGLLSGYAFLGGRIGSLMLAAFAVYFASRGAARFMVMKELHRKYGSVYERISLLPSMKGLLKWHFVLEGSACDVIGEKDILRNRIRILKKLVKSADSKNDSVLSSPVGRFFTEFTPLSNIAVETTGGTKRYVFTDMRYYMRNKFLHHAVLELDENNTIVRQTFNPYSMSRSCIIE